MSLLWIFVLGLLPLPTITLISVPLIIHKQRKKAQEKFNRLMDEWFADARIEAAREPEPNTPYLAIRYVPTWDYKEMEEVHPIDDYYKEREYDFLLLGNHRYGYRAKYKTPKNWFGI